MKKLIMGSLLLLLLLTMTGCRSGENGEVYVYSYGDYYDPEVVADFEADTGIRVIQDTYDTAEEMYPIIKNGSANYDVVCTSDYMISKMKGENLLQKLDKKNIRNIKNLDEDYMRKAEEYDPGNEYSVPYLVGVSGILYNKKMVKGKKIDSWNALWDPDFKNNIVMQDSVRDAFAISLLRLGYSPNTTNPKEIEEAKNALKEQKKLVYKYANDSARDLLADKSAAIGVVLNGEYNYTHDHNKDFEFVVPKEVSEFLIDSCVVPKSARNKRNAERFINYMCKAKVAKRNFDYLYYTTPNTAAIKMIPSKYVSNPALFPSKETIARCTLLRNLDPDTTKLYGDSWKEVKSK